MKNLTRMVAVAALLPVFLTSGACTRVQARAAFKDGNKDYKEENFKRAIEDYEKALSHDPNMAEAWFYLGSSHQALYRPGKEAPENKEHMDKAVEAFKKSLELNKAETDNLKKVRLNTLGALTGIYSDDPYKDFDTAKGYADQLVRDDPENPKNLYAIANLYEKFGHIAEAEATYKRVSDGNLNDAKACGALAAFYNKPLWDDQGTVWLEGSDRVRRAKFDQAVEILERCAALTPQDPSGYYKVASFYWDKAYRDPLITDEQKATYVEKGLAAIDKALSIKPDYFEAIVYKGLLYRVKASLQKDPRQKQALEDEAALLQKQGLELKKQQQAEQAAAAAAAAAAPKP